MQLADGSVSATGHSRTVIRSCRRLTGEGGQQVDPVKALYEELDLPAVFLQYEEDTYSHIMGLIEQYAALLPPAIFLGLARKIYKRKK